MARSVNDHKNEITSRQDKILETYLKFYPNHETSRIEKAVYYGELFHRGQLRRSGDPYIFHPLTVALYCAEAGLDESCIISAMLHDTVEDTVATEDKVVELFGSYISDIVSALTKIRSFSAASKEKDRQSSVKKILNAASRDIRPLLIKIYDRLSNMREMEHMSEAHRKRVSKETLEVYTVLAQRLGMYKDYRSLVNLSLRYLYPKDCAQIAKRLDIHLEQFGNNVETFSSRLIEDLSREEIQAEVNPIWPEPADFYREIDGWNPNADIRVKFQILIDNVISLYTALGVLHNTFVAVPLSVKDYVANPLANGFKALKTKLVFDKEIFKFELLTHEMDDVNDTGVIYNWKQNANRLSSYYTNYMNLLAELLADDEIRMDEVLSQTQVAGMAVYSPRKDLYIMPEGSTCLDFAYEIHREVGNSAKVARVNGIERPLEFQLHSGNVVDISTDDAVQPEEIWLKKSTTPKAHAAIRRAIRKRTEERAAELGKDIWNREIEKYGLDPSALIASKDFGVILEKQKLKLKEFYKKIAYHQIIPSQFVSTNNIISKDRIAKQQKVESTSMREKLFSALRSDQEEALKFDINDVFIKYATCCNPIFGDNVVGVVKAERGIEVHRDTCTNLKEIPASKQVRVRWDDDKPIKSAVLNLHVGDRKGVLARIFRTVNKRGINMSQFDASTLGSEAYLKLRVDVKNIRELVKLVNDLRKIDDIFTITRES